MKMTTKSRAAYNRAWRKANPDKVLEYRRRFVAAHPEKFGPMTRAARTVVIVDGKPVFRSRTKEYKAAKARAWRAANKARYWAAKQRYKARHPEIVKARNKRYRERHKEKCHAVQRDWCKRHPDRVRELAKNTMRRCRENLTPGAVRRAIIGTSKTIKARDIPEPLIDTFREYLKLKRTCRKLQTSKT